MKEKKYILEMNERQAQLLSWALDTFPRIIQGQDHAIQDILESAWDKRCKKATGKMMDDGFEGGWQKMREDAERLVAQMRWRFWGQTGGTYNGIHYDETADILWSMHTVLRHELWKNRPGPKIDWTVDAFPGTQFTDEPLIKVTSL
jgi:hypothetical protein